MTLQRVLVVDDEENARAELAYLLESSGRVAEVEEAADSAQALIRLQEDRYDAVFLDIRMPGLDGLQLAQTLRQFARPPALVFVTAYEEHAVDAFGLEARDYLLKPVSGERLAATLDRLTGSGPDGARRLGTASLEEAASPEDLPFIGVEVGDKTVLVERSEIRYVEAEGDYVRLHTADAGHLVRCPLSALEERWAPHGFVRVHRSYLVNLRHVVEIQPYFNQTLVVKMDDAEGSVVPVSRRRARELKERLRLSRG